MQPPLSLKSRKVYLVAYPEASFNIFCVVKFQNTSIDGFSGFFTRMLFNKHFYYLLFNYILVVFVPTFFVRPYFRVIADDLAKTSLTKSSFMLDSISIWSNFLIPVMLVFFIYFGYLLSMALFMTGQVLIALWVVINPANPSYLAIFFIILAMNLQIYSSQGFFILVSDKLFGRTGALVSSMIAVISELFYTVSRLEFAKFTKVFKESNKHLSEFLIAGLCFICFLSIWFVFQLHMRIRQLNIIQSEI